MFYLIFYSFKDEVKKVSLARLLKKERGMPLGEAKNAVDKLMEGTPLLFSFKDRIALMHFKEEAVLLGIKCKSKDIATLPFFIEKDTISKPRRNTLNSKSNKKGKPEFEKILVY